MPFFRFFLFVLLIIGCSFYAVAQDSELEGLIEEFKGVNKVLDGRFFVGEELIFTVVSEGFKLGEVNATVLESGIAFDFESYNTVFDFPISFNAATSSYSGWFIQETNTFKLDHLTPNPEDSSIKVTLSDREITIAADNYQFIDDSLFLHSSSYTDSYQISHEFDYARLRIKVSSVLGLPFLRQLLRRKGASLSTGQQKPSFVNLPRGYEILSPQILDAQIGAVYRESNDTVVTNYSLQGARDIAMWHSQFSVSGTDTDIISNTRLNFSRQSSQGKLFGNTGITRFEFGDVRDIRQGSGQFLNESTGVRFGNTDLSNQFETDLIVIDGDIPTGWDVELYRNNVLLKQEFDNQTGRYNFLDVPLIFGQNNFEVVLYGPQGQVKRRTITKLLDENIFSKKDFTYEVSLTDTNNSLFTNSNVSDLLDPGFNLSGRAKVYLFDNAALDFGFRSQFGGDEASNLISVGVNSVLFDDVLLNTYIEADDNNLINVTANARTQWMRQSISLQARVSDATNVFDRQESLLTLGVDGDINFADNFSIPLSQQFGYRESDESRTFSYSNRIGLRVGRVSLFNAYTYERDENVTGQTLIKQFGNLSLQANLGRIFARAGVVYSPDQNERIITTQASVNWNINKMFRTGVIYTQDYLNDNDSVTSQLSYIGDDFRISARVGHSDLSGADVGINASFSLSGQNQQVNKVAQSAFAQTTTGSLAVRVFLDLNLNSVFDANDVPLPDVEVKALQFYKSAVTDESGVALLTRLSNLTSSDIVIDRDTLPDSFMRPRVEGVSITTRAGLIDFLDYPIVSASEISGIIDVSAGDEIKPGKNIMMSLLDESQRVVSATKSEYDGYFAFVDVMPGKYKIVVNEESLQRFDLEASMSESIEVVTQPDVIEIDILAKQKKYQEVYVSQISMMTGEKLMPLALLKLRQRLSLVGQNVQVYKGAKSTHYSFFTASDPNKEAIEFICGALRINNIKCEPTKLLLN